MRRPAAQIAEDQAHCGARPPDNNKEGPERLHKDMRQRRALSQRLLVHPEVSQPEHLQHARDNRRAVDPGEPQQMADQHRQ